MTDLLYVSFDKNEKNGEVGLCVCRVNDDGRQTILKMELDDQAEILYRLLTEQMTKAEIKAEGSDNE